MLCIVRQHVQKDLHSLETHGPYVRNNGPCVSKPRRSLGPAVQLIYNVHVYSIHVYSIMYIVPTITIIHVQYIHVVLCIIVSTIYMCTCKLVIHPYIYVHVHFWSHSIDV